MVHALEDFSIIQDGDHTAVHQLFVGGVDVGVRYRILDPVQALLVPEDFAMGLQVLDIEGETLQLAVGVLVEEVLVGQLLLLGLLHV